MDGKNTILIVDDYEFNRMILSEMFPERDIIVAENGSAAIEEYEKHKGEICCVLTDVMMPVTDGIELLQYFNKNHVINEIPVFIVSADTSTNLFTKAYQLGAEDVITKPFNIQFVKKHINHIIELYELRNIL